MVTRARTRTGRPKGGATGRDLRHDPSTPDVTVLLARLADVVAETGNRPVVTESATRGPLIQQRSMFPDQMVEDAIAATNALKIGGWSLCEFIENRINATKKKPGAPKRVINVRAWFVAAFLAGVDGRAVSGTEIALALYTRMSDEARAQLGLVSEPVPPPPGRKLARWLGTRERRVQRELQSILRMCDPSPYPKGVVTPWDTLDQSKKVMTEAQETELQQALDLITGTVLRLPWQYLPPENRAKYDGSACIDATPLPLYARGRTLDDVEASSDPDGGYYVREGDHRGDDKKPPRAKTFALDAHVMVAADVTHSSRRYLPALPITVTLGRPGIDPAGAARRMLTTLAAHGHKPNFLAGDNLYTLSDKDCFQQPARELGWKLVLPYPGSHTGVQGSSNGAPLIEGAYYCPSMPEPLISATEDYRADRISRAVYDERIAARQSYALRYYEVPKPGGTERRMCPAAGDNPTAICPLKPASAVPRLIHDVGGRTRLDLRPIISPTDDLRQNPPKVCRQKTITIQPEEGSKYRQTLPFGSPEHSLVYTSLRQAQEGLHGVAKDQGKEGLGDPGRRRVRGLAANTLFGAIMLASAGLRMVASFINNAEHDEHGVLYVKRVINVADNGPPGEETPAA